jgi:hypothetical protein
LFVKEVSGGEEDKLAGRVADEGVAHPAKGWGMGGKEERTGRGWRRREDIYTEFHHTGEMSLWLGKVGEAG